MDPQSAFSPLSLKREDLVKPGYYFETSYKPPTWAPEGTLSWTVRFKDQVDKTEPRSCDYLARSKMWKHALLRGEGAICIVNPNRRPSGQKMRSNVTLTLILNALKIEADSMDFQTKVDLTMVNLGLLTAKSKTHGEFWLPYAQGISQSQPIASGLSFAIRDDSQSMPNDGRVYGFSSTEERRVLEEIRNLGYIESHRDYEPRYKNKPALLFELTPTGYRRADELSRSAAADPKRGFLIRRYQLHSDSTEDEAHSNALKSIVKHLSSQGYHLKAAWEDKANNENLDDYILRQIRESAFVVVEVPPKATSKTNGESTNVGLEVGYALGIGRTVVAIQYYAGGNGEPNLPFDLAMAPCTTYGSTPSDAEKRRILARVQNASEDARRRI
ncbi:MAG: hypothetical protein AB7F50_05845 [Fimbriimonadaceae bacterium]